ncbi:MAG: hypothetical protein NVV74_24180 [Magnetospirillum sp.]|nr:hypothetical protein [Magnetospirillum sp.]
MAITNHLFRREATYYWRSRLPLSLGSILGRSHLARSLRTKEPNRARRLARRLSAVVEEVSHLLKVEAMTGRKPPTRADLDRILLDLFTEVLETGEVMRAARPAGYSPFTISDDDEDAAAAVAGQTDPHTGEPLDARDLQEDQMEPDTGKNWRTNLKHNVLTPIIPSVEAMLSERNLDRLADDADWRLFLRKAMATVGAALDIESEREQGIYRAPTCFCT